MASNKTVLLVLSAAGAAAGAWLLFNRKPAIPPIGIGGGQGSGGSNPPVPVTADFQGLV